jgi:hypothetical protein
MEWLTWDYWGTDKTEIVRSLGLVLGIAPNPICDFDAAMDVRGPGSSGKRGAHGGTPLQK